MKSGDIVSLFQKYESKKKASSPSPFQKNKFVIFQFYVKKTILIYFMNFVDPFMLNRIL